MDARIPAQGSSRGRGGQMVTFYQHFRYEIFNVLLDQIITKLNNRFAELRNKMGDDWLNYSMLCNIEREIFAKVVDDDDAIIYRFQSYKTREGILPPRSSKCSTFYNVSCFT